MNPEDKDLFILVLDAGITHQKDGITFNELRKFIEDNGCLLPNKADIDLLSRLYYDVFFKDPGKTDSRDEKRFLNEDGYFKYLNYKALCQARKASSRATFLAVTAILIAAASLVVAALHCS